MKIKLSTLIVFSGILLATQIASVSVIAQVINYTGFEDFDDETAFTQSSWYEEGFTVLWTNGFNQSRAHVDDAYAMYGSKSLRISYPANTYGPQTNGAQAKLKVTDEEELFVSYWLRFSDNFDWGGSYEGGKLPGLACGANCSGCNVCTGNNGFTARLMWRAGGRGVLYLYHMEEDKLNPPCGSDFALQVSGSDFYFEKGEWYNIIQRVKINTGSNHDGEVEVWINQEQALLLTDVQFISNGDMVDNLAFSTFHGGNSSDWAPSEDCFIWFDNILIASEAEDVFNFTDLNDHSINREINAYPNPVKANSILKLELDEHASKQYKIEWLNFSGKTVYTSEMNTGLSIVVPNLPSGIYMLKLTLSEEVILKKIVVE